MTVDLVLFKPKILELCLLPSKGKSPVKWKFKCNGIVISNTQVLTSAQCVYNYNFVRDWYVVSSRHSKDLNNLEKRLRRKKSKSDKFNSFTVNV